MKITLKSLNILLNVEHYSQNLKHIKSWNLLLNVETVWCRYDPLLKSIWMSIYLLFILVSKPIHIMEIFFPDFPDPFLITMDFPEFSQTLDRHPFLNSYLGKQFISLNSIAPIWDIFLTLKRKVLSTVSTCFGLSEYF